LAGRTPLNGCLDRLREHLEVLDEAIVEARKLSKVRKGASGRDTIQGLKILRDLVEQRNLTLDRIQAHLLGRDQTGAITEPADAWDKNPQVEYERYFRNQLVPWTQNDLKLECEDCGVRSENVSNRYFEEQRGPKYELLKEGEAVNLCSKCYHKRNEQVEAGE